MTMWRASPKRAPDGGVSLWSSPFVSDELHEGEGRAAFYALLGMMVASGWAPTDTAPAVGGPPLGVTLTKENWVRSLGLEVCAEDHS